MKKSSGHNAGNSVGYASDWRAEDPAAFFFLETDHATVILPLPLINDRQSSVFGERMYTSTG